MYSDENVGDHWSITFYRMDALLMPNQQQKYPLQNISICCGIYFVFSDVYACCFDQNKMQSIKQVNEL